MSSNPAGIAILLAGILIALQGRLLYRISIGLIGFGAGFLLVYRFTLELARELALVLSIAGGIVGAALMTFLHKVGIFAAGAVAAVAALSVFVPAPSLVLMAIAAVIGGIISLVMKKVLIAVSTSAVGAYTAVAGAAIIVEGSTFASNEELWNALSRGDIVPREPLYIAAFLAIWGLGLWVQLRSKRKKHDD